MALPQPASGPYDDQIAMLEGHSDDVRCIAFSPDGSLLASGSYDRTIRLWSIVLGTQIATLQGHFQAVLSVTFSPDGLHLASGSYDGIVHLWDVESKAQVATMNKHIDCVWSVAFSPDSAYLASGSFDRTVGVWDAASGNNIHILKGHSGSVYPVVFSPDGKQITSGSSDCTIRFWDPVSGDHTGTMQGHSSDVNSIAFSPNGERLASGSKDNTIILWDATSRSILSILQGHSRSVFSVAFSPNGEFLASASNDMTIRLWDAVSGAHISTLEGHSDWVRAVAFSPDGALLASASHDKTIRIRGAATEKAKGRTLTSTYEESIVSGSYLYDSVQSHIQDDVTLAFVSIPLKNDITGLVSLTNTSRMGSGGFGEVFLGNHQDRGKVALKRPHTLLDETSVRRFLREVDLWCSVSHRYILPCLGACKIGSDVYVVSPFVEGGDLMTCIRKGRDLNRSKLLYEVAEALTHLHHRGIVHGDVKAQNVLLSDDGSALLCDFGLAKAFDSMVTSTEAKGTGSVRWMAPELFEDGSRSMATDVYSFGITIAEVLSGRPPFSHIPDNIKVVLRILQKNERPPKEPLNSSKGESYTTLWEVAEKCWVTEPQDRPYMAEVLAMLFPLTRLPANVRTGLATKVPQEAKE